MRLEELTQLTWGDLQGPYPSNDTLARNGYIYLQECTNVPRDYQLRKIFFEGFWLLWNSNLKAKIRDEMGIRPRKDEYGQWSRIVRYVSPKIESSQPQEEEPIRAREEVAQIQEIELSDIELQYIRYIREFPYQIPHVKRLIRAFHKNNGVIIDGSDTGTGKTYTAIAMAKELGLVPLIICPKSVIYSWVHALEHFGFTNVGNLVNGDFDDNVPYIANYECIGGAKMLYFRQSKGRTKFNRKPCRYLSVEKVVNGKGRLVNNKHSFQWHLPPNRLVIFDEVHRCKNGNTANAWLLMAAKTCGAKIIGLSATVAESPIKMRAVGYALGLFRSYRDYYVWTRQYGCISNRFGGMSFYGNEHAIQRLHHEIYPDRGARMAIKDLGNLFPEIQVSAELYNTDNENQINEVYTQMQDELDTLASTASNDRFANILVAILRARQKVEILKVPIFLELIEDYLESDNSVVIFMNFDASIDALAQRVRGLIIDEKRVGISFIRGGQKLEDRDAEIRAFQDDTNRVCICNIRAGGVGISLHDLNGHHARIALISPSFSAQDLLQALGRIHRAGAKSKAIERIVFAAGSDIEERTCKAIQRKVRNINLINDGDLSKGIDIAPEVFKLDHKIKKELTPEKIEQSLKNGIWDLKIDVVSEDKQETFQVML